MPDPKADAAKPKTSGTKTLSQVALFAGLSEGEITYLAQRAIPHKFAAGEIVFSEDEPCFGMYVVEAVEPQSMLADLSAP